MRVLLIEPYCGGSHKAWAEGYVGHSDHQVDLLALPARFWKWRMQGGGATMAARALRLEAVPDVILASDMLNLPAFLGLTRAELGDVPVVLYFHENQLTYPLPPGEVRDLTYGMINWLSMLAAERVVFNSAYHLEEWFDELPRMLRHFPDYSHERRIPEVRGKSGVLPVGCDLGRLDRARTGKADQGAPLILWSHRWEYDKDPNTFFRALDVLAEEGVPFRVALAGPNVRQMPDEFEAARQRLGERVVHYGYAEAEYYVHLLWQADIVISTAQHEFFGVAMVEAIYCECLPLLPRGLVYPELLVEEYHTLCLYDSFDDLLRRLRRMLTEPGWGQGAIKGLRDSVARFDWGVVAPMYDELMESVGGRG